MVYVGKPSKACGRCRQRRLKCDFEKPQCRKCRVASVVCPGYRNEQDLLFRDVTDQVVERHHNCAPKASRRNIASAKRLDLNNDMLYGGLMTVALRFLFVVYIRGSSFEWVPALYEKVSNSSLFAKVVRATALATYSHESHRVKLLAQARSTYDDALLQLREVIAAGSIDDTVLASILLMSRFETLLNDGNAVAAIENWTGHISGAFSIVHSRPDEENFATELSYRLFERVVHNYNLLCISKTTSRPQALIEATNKLLLKPEFIKPLGEMRLRFHALSDDFQAVRHICEESNVDTFPAALQRALDSDTNVLRFVNDLSAISSYQMRCTGDLQQDEYELDYEMHSDTYHIYRDQHEARLWNSTRLLRLTLRFDIIHTITRIDDDDLTSNSRKLVEDSRQIILQMCADICASAPQFLRFGSNDCTHAAASYLAWPLFVAARVDKGCQAFVEASLTWIGQELNIKSAQDAAIGLSEEHYDDDWLLACYVF